MHVLSGISEKLYSGSLPNREEKHNECDTMSYPASRPSRRSGCRFGDDRDSAARPATSA